MARAKWTAHEADELRSAIGHFVRVGRHKDEMPRPQAIALGYLDREGALTIADLAERAGVRHQTMRVTLANLTEEQAVAMRKSPDDGRKVLCEITDRGREILNQDREIRTGWILERIKQRLDPEEQDVARRIAGVLRRLADDA